MQSAVRPSNPLGVLMSPLFWKAPQRGLLGPLLAPQPLGPLLALQLQGARQRSLLGLPPTTSASPTKVTPERQPLTQCQPDMQWSWMRMPRLSCQSWDCYAIPNCPGHCAKFVT